MNLTDIAYLSATETARAVKAKELSPIDAVQAYLERIDRLDSRLAAYITVVREEALGAAQLVAERIGRGEDPGPLAGVPIAVKDQDGRSIGYTIVGSTEADHSQGKISNVSPIGKSHLGKRIGEIAEVDVPSGKIRLEVIAIE